MYKLGVGIIGCGAVLEFTPTPLKIRIANSPQLPRKENAARKAAAQYSCDFALITRSCCKIRIERSISVRPSSPAHGHRCAESRQTRSDRKLLPSMRRICKWRNCGACETPAMFQNRFNQTSVKAREVLDSGMLGRIKGIKGIVTWYRDSSYYTESGWRDDRERAGGGVLITQALHTLDLMQWFCGEAERIKGYADTRCFRGVIEVEDTAEATIWFKNGARGIFYATVCFTDNSPVVIEIHCEKGFLTIWDGELYLARDGKRELLARDQLASGEKAYWGLSHEKLIKHFYKCILQDTADYISVPDAYVSVEMAMGIYESSANGCEYHLRGRQKPELAHGTCEPEKQTRRDAIRDRTHKRPVRGEKWQEE